MMKLFKRTKQIAVELCDRCSKARDSVGRSNAFREQIRDRALASRGRLA